MVSYRDVDEGWVTEADGLKNEYRRRSIPIVEHSYCAGMKGINAIGMDHVRS